MKNPDLIREQLLALARVAQANQQEACGILAAEPDGNWTVVPLPNELSPGAVAAVGFSMDPGALRAALGACEVRGARLAAFWHSHPGSSALPGSADRYAAWKGVPFYICAPDAHHSLRAWVWSDTGGGGCFSETPLEGEDTPTPVPARA